MLSRSAGRALSHSVTRGRGAHSRHITTVLINNIQQQYVIVTTINLINYNNSRRQYNTLDTRRAPHCIPRENKYGFIFLNYFFLFTLMMTQARVRSACPRRSDVNVCLCARVFVRSEGFGLSSLLRRRCREESGLPLPIQPEMRARDLPPCVHVLRCSLRRLGAGRGACKARACNISLENGLNSRRFIIHTQIDFGDIFTQLYVTHTHMCTLCIVYCVLCAVPARARAADPDS